MDTDLFGDPLPVGEAVRGRPPHVPTVANRDRVSLLLALGWSNERIANAIRVSVPTLRKCYRDQLKARILMRDRLDARLAEKLWDGVSAGNVGAIKEFRKFLERNDQMDAARDFRARTQAPDMVKEEKLGKKAQRQANAEARSSAGVFAVPPPPPSLVQ